MTEKCLPIVDWLKSWFKPRTEDYFYDMTVSDYNPSIDSTVSISVFVTDGNNSPVRNHSFQLWIGDTTSTTLTTDSEGSASYTHTCSEWGLCRFSVKSYTCFITVEGWRTYLQTPIWLVEYNETTTRISLASTVRVNSTTSETRFGTVLLSDWWLRPKKPMMFPTYNGNVLVIAKEGVDTLTHRTITGSVTMTSQYFQIEWSHQGLH